MITEYFTSVTNLLYSLPYCIDECLFLLYFRIFILDFRIQIKEIEMTTRRRSSNCNPDGDNADADGRTVMDMGNDSYAGLRLQNDSKVECYLNTAINTVVTNEILMGEVVREDPLKLWGKKCSYCMIQILSK